jgi:hypothetical protein
MLHGGGVRAGKRTAVAVAANQLAALCHEETGILGCVAGSSGECGAILRPINAAFDDCAPRWLPGEMVCEAQRCLSASLPKKGFHGGPFNRSEWRYDLEMAPNP